MKIKNNNYASTENYGNKKTTKDKFSMEVGNFQRKVKDRLENGETVYTMGMTSMTEQDWEDLMKNIDVHMKKVRELKDIEDEQIKDKMSEKDVYNRIIALTKE